MVIATDWVPLFISLVAILARLHWRFNIARQRLPASDACLCLAWCSAAVNACFDIYWFRSGVLTPHMDYLLAAYQGTPEELQKLLRVSDSNFLLGAKDVRSNDTTRLFGGVTYPFTRHSIYARLPSCPSIYKYSLAACASTELLCKLLLRIQRLDTLCRFC
jgi:hypothetical protein